MHITCNRELLQKYIASADRITGKHLSLPILNSVLLVAQNKTLIIRSTNLEVGVEFQIPVDVKVEGSIAIPGGLFTNILSSMSDEQYVTIETKDGVCKITTKNKTLQVKGFTPDDFPTIPIIQGEEGFIINSSKFTQGVKSVVMSAAISDIKPEISSVYMYKNGEFLIFVATDSFRLSEKKIKQPGITLSQGVIIPVKNIIEIIKVLESVNEDINFIITKNQISCTGNSFYITSRITQGIYPDYEQILPKTNTTEITILKEDLINTLKLSTLFSDKFNKITITVSPKQKIFKISTKNTEIGETESNLTATLMGEPIEISINGKHLFESLSVVEKDSIVIQFNGTNKPIVIRGLGDSLFTYLTMPLTR
ncbi:MAG: DNA polymerase III subunit beta [Patescibacteria group bacterium]